LIFGKNEKFLARAKYKKRRKWIKSEKKRKKLLQNEKGKYFFSLLAIDKTMENY